VVGCWFDPRGSAKIRGWSLFLVFNLRIQRNLRLKNAGGIHASAFPVRDMWKLRREVFSLPEMSTLAASRKAYQAEV
jgi:hypothetical protein